MDFTNKLLREIENKKEITSKLLVDAFQSQVKAFAETHALSLYNSVKEKLETTKKLVSTREVTEEISRLLGKNLSNPDNASAVKKQLTEYFTNVAPFPVHVIYKRSDNKAYYDARITDQSLNRYFSIFSDTIEDEFGLVKSFLTTAGITAVPLDNFYQWATDTISKTVR
jgi:hypothetical protein